MTTKEFNALPPEVRDRARIQGAPRPAQDERRATIRQKTTLRRFIAAPIVSEANQGGKLRTKINRKMAQKRAIVEAFGTELLNAGKPKRVTFVLITSQEQDDDNLRRTFKVYRDQIARSCGFDDRERVWKYLQRKKFRYENRGCWIVVQW